MTKSCSFRAALFTYSLTRKSIFLKIDFLDNPTKIIDK